MATDYQGLELTTESAEAAAAYSRTVDAGVYMKAALAADGEMAMTLITRGYFFHLFAIPALARKAVEAAAAAEQAIASRGANQRETWHLAALQAWNRGAMQQTVDHWEQILLRYPHDALVVRLTNFMHFYTNGGAAIRQSSSRIIGPILAICWGCMPFPLKKPATMKRPRRWASGRWRSMTRISGPPTP